MAFGDNWEQMANRGADQYSDEWHKSKKDLRMARASSQSDVVAELVDERFGCPVCGNVDMDTLVWNEETDLVTCGRCVHRLQPDGGLTWHSATTGSRWRQRGCGQYSDEWRKSKKDKRIEELTEQVEALTREIKALRDELKALREFVTR